MYRYAELIVRITGGMIRKMMQCPSANRKEGMSSFFQALGTLCYLPERALRPIRMVPS